jgi:hypothetical protein
VRRGVVQLLARPWERSTTERKASVLDGLQTREWLEPVEVFEQTGTQELTRIDERGVSEELVGVPVELLLEEPAG